MTAIFLSFLSALAYTRTFSRANINMFIRPTAIFTAASRAARTQVLARGYASALSRDDIQSRVLDVVKGFDKVDASKVNKS